MDAKFRMGLINRVSGEVIPEHEPTVTFRARDVHLMALLQFYHTIVRSEDHRRAIGETMQIVEDWQVGNKHRMKEPGISGDYPYREEEKRLEIRRFMVADWFAYIKSFVIKNNNIAEGTWSDGIINKIRLTEHISSAPMTEDVIRGWLEKGRFGPAQ